MVFKDENDTIRTPLEPSNVRKGRFLWKQKNEQLSYVQMLKNRIAQGFYTSDRVLTAVVDDLAPILGETDDPHPESDSTWESLAIR